MATEIQRHQPSTGLSLRPSRQQARSILAQPITWISALKSAKRLVGSFANCKPSDPDQFAEAVASVLMKYPQGLVDEVCDPTRGLALKEKFMSIDALYAWCEARKADFTEIAFPKVPQLEPPSDPTMGARVAAFFKGIGDMIRAKAPSPLDELQEQRAEARKLRLDEVKRLAAEAPLSGQPYKPLCDWKYRPVRKGAE